MADPQHQSKRRRLDAAATLSKPFKSPLRRPASSSTLPSAASSSSSSQPAARPTLSKIESTAISEGPKCNPSPESSSEVTRSLPRAHKPVTTSLSTPTRPPHPDPEVLELQKKQRSLQCRLAALRSELDTARQALRIESSTKDAELAALVHKWRFISQEAADEVFTSARERVSHMGGMAAWRERTKRETTSWGFQDDANRWSEHSEDLNGTLADEGELDARRTEVESAVVGLGNGKDRSRSEDEEQQDEQFTMEFMLKTLNIEPKTIGFDPLAQRWIRD